jgi:ribonuclease P protein subunit POP4
LIQRPENLARHELIGLSVIVAESTDNGLVGISGMIVDETRNTFLVETERGMKRIPKSNTSLTLALQNGQKVKVSGSILISQPENRINKRIKSSRWKL